MGEPFYINYFDAIDSTRVKALMAICTNIVNSEKPDTLYFLFSSPGGQVQAGITLYNFLRALPTKVVMHNTGSIDSIATAIFLAGEERYASTSSSFLFHGVALNFKDGTTHNLSKLRECVSGLSEDENKIAKIITDRSQLTDPEIRQLFREGESKDPTFAQSKGFIQSIKDAKVPPSAKFITVNLDLK